MEWEFLEPQTIPEFLKRIRNQDYPSLFKAENISVLKISVPFYPGFDHYMVENHQIEPPFTLEYLASSDKTVYLDGSFDPFAYLNANNHLNLNQNTVIDYLRFVCVYKVQRPHDILLLQGEKNCEFRDTVFLDFQFDSQNYTDDDIHVSFNNDDQSYTVRAPFIFAGKIDLGIAHITHDGTIDIQPENPR